MYSNDHLLTTRDIVNDYFNWRLTNTTMTNNRICQLVRQMGYDSEQKYGREPSVKFHFLSDFSLMYVKDLYYELAKELFCDEIINWGRIITLISFSAILIEQILEQQEQNHDSIIESFIQWTTNFIDNDLETWMKEQNYWVGFLQTVDKTSNRRSSLGRYASILGTLGMLTFGALYINRI